MSEIVAEAIVRQVRQSDDYGASSELVAELEIIETVGCPLSGRLELHGTMPVRMGPKMGLRYGPDELDTVYVGGVVTVKVR